MKEKFKFVVDNSEYVKINYKALDNFVSALDKPCYKHWCKDLNLNLEEDEWILLVFLIEAMNFCFWIKPKWKINYHEEILSGSNALFYSVIREVEENPNFLKIDYLKNLSLDDFAKIFKSVEGVIPLLEYRYNNFMEVVNVFKTNKNIYHELKSLKKDTFLLQYITTNFISFCDQSIYKGQVIPFHKRANLLVNDLFYVSKSIHDNIKNVDNLSGCADYGIPRVFHDYGILEYREDLENKIKGEEEILHDSNMEIEIRANMLYVIELLTEKLREKNIFINAISLDNIIWLMGKRSIKKSNHHKTITIYY